MVSIIVLSLDSMADVMKPYQVDDSLDEKAPPLEDPLHFGHVPGEPLSCITFLSGLSSTVKHTAEVLDIF